MKRLTILWVWMLVWSAATLSFGANLGVWPLTADGVGTSDEAGAVTVGNFVGGSGIGSITFGSKGGYANSWTTGASVEATDYFEVTIAPESGFDLVISEIEYSERRSGTGIREFQVRSSIDDFGSYTVLATETVPDNDSERSYSITDLNITVLAGEVFRLRFYGYLAEGGTGNWRFNDGTLKIMGVAVSTTGAPTITFSPGNDVQVHVSNLLEVAVSLFPSGSGIDDWSIIPTPSGSTSLSGGTFSFTPAAPDDGETFTLSVVATNSYGTTTGTLDIAVTEYLLPGTYEITFDNAGEVKTSYASGVVSLNGRDWILDQARIGDTDSDVKIGIRAARFGSYYQATMTSSNALLPTGLDTISFLYAQYGGGDAGAELVVEVATDVALGDWMEVGRVDANGVTELTEYQASVKISEAMYMRIRTEYTPSVGQVNVDSILIVPYQTPSYTPYETFLLDYNVTPGDPGTATNENLDGDLFTNEEEFNADTNPYDAAIHP